MIKCPVCGKVLQEPGYEFGELKFRCYTCSCGSHVIVGGGLPEERARFKPNLYMKASTKYTKKGY